VRLEQLYPFPAEDYAAIIEKYDQADEIVWCQEEPENQGAWYQIKHRLQVPLSNEHTLLYATRAGSSTTAAGYHKLHVKQQEAVVEAGLTGGNELIEKGSIRTRGRKKQKKSK
jgi:2-oxoglutarate dehydrogenase E1 component